MARNFGRSPTSALWPTSHQRSCGPFRDATLREQADRALDIAREPVKHLSFGEQLAYLNEENRKKDKAREALESAIAFNAE